ncbi:MAG: GTPase ObgE [Proteobacteria bacterium]|nr:MAG: GTPase ObgE [Pseudomonadota bacterium]
MRFIDEVEIDVKAGDGGNGCSSFRREAHVPRGGPNGGDGGRGGDIVVEATRNVSTLLDLRYQRRYKAERGKPGQGQDKHGRRGVDTLIAVPRGTLVINAETGETIADLIEDGQRVVAAQGGAGGRGNARFSTPTNRAPREFEEGQPGDELTLRLELKLLAEVGLVGLPSAGKSTLISRVSKAKPKIADYHFTTLIPNLGMVMLPGFSSSGEARSFVMADIPGLIEGAADGAGLGHRFLKHVERTAVLVYLLDDRHWQIDEGDPAGDLRVLHSELVAYSEALAAKPSLVVLNKRDALDPERQHEILGQLTEASAELLADAPPPHAISAVTGDGLEPLLDAIWPVVEAARSAREIDPDHSS